MILLRRNFSKDWEKFSSGEDTKRDKDIAATIGALTGAGIGSSIAKEGDNIINKKLGKGIYKGHDRPEDIKIKNNLLKKAKDKGMRIIDDPYAASSSMHTIIDTNTGKAIDVIVNSPKSNAATLAHEMGHGYYNYHKNTKGGKIGKLVHKVSDKIDLLDNPGNWLYDSKKDTVKINEKGQEVLTKHGKKRLRMGNIVTNAVGLAEFANGLDSGLRAERNKSQGKKQSTFNKIKPYILPIALGTPALVREGMASAKGLKLMKESGASKKLINDSRKHLIRAGATYLPTGHLINAAAGDVAGHVIGKQIYKKDDSTKKR